VNRFGVRGRRYQHLAMPQTSNLLPKREGFCIANLKGLHLGSSPLGRLGGAKKTPIKEASVIKIKPYV